MNKDPGDFDLRYGEYIDRTEQKDQYDYNQYIKEHEKSPEAKRKICPHCECNKWASEVDETDDVYFRCTNCGYKRELFE